MLQFSDSTAPICANRVLGDDDHRARAFLIIGEARDLTNVRNYRYSRTNRGIGAIDRFTQAARISGYDSTGLATLNDGRLERRRAEGKLKNLEARLLADPLSGDAGIGHTRWATHGKPTEHNAHPHATERVAVVHNGIIENFRKLRQTLEDKGATFTSDTDTEVVVHLVHSYLLMGYSPQEAVWASLPQLRGAFALVFLFNGYRNLLIGARRGSPLAVGYGKGETYLGSDAIALAPFADGISYLEDGDWVELSREKG